MSFLTRFAAGETGGAPYFTSGDDYANFNPTFHGDKPLRASEVIRLLQKAAGAGGAEAKGLLAEKQLGRRGPDFRSAPDASWKAAQRVRVRNPDKLLTTQRRGGFCVGDEMSTP